MMLKIYFTVCLKYIKLSPQTKENLADADNCVLILDSSLRPIVFFGETIILSVYLTG
jgi:hypothetical protein